jgi:hypothetical protein
VIAFSCEIDLFVGMVAPLIIMNYWADLEKYRPNQSYSCAANQQEFNFGLG